VVDVARDAAEATAAQIASEGGEGCVEVVDATREADCRELVSRVRERWQRIDVLHNNVGIGGGDASPMKIEEDAWDRILAVNLKSVVLPCKHVLPVMREQGEGAITNISSAGAVCAMPTVAYKVSKAGVNAYTQTLAMGNAKYGIRANVIMPGLMNTPMAVEGLSRELGIPKQELIARRDAQVPLRGRMGSAWDVAHAALFLASDEARFITGVVLPVDGGQSARIG